MTLINATIDVIIAGDHVEIPRTITLVPVGTSIVRAWLTIKAGAGPNTTFPILLQKEITGSFVAGQGQITDDGASDRTGVFFFEFDQASATAIGIMVWRFYDIQLLTAHTPGRPYTAEIGRFRIRQGITDEDTP